MFQIEIHRGAAHHIRLIVQFRLGAEVERTHQTGAGFTPRGFHRNDGSVTVHERAPRHVVVIVVVVDIEPAERRQDDSGADCLVSAEVVL